MEREIPTGSIAPSASRLVIYRTSALGLGTQPDYVAAASSPALPCIVVCDLAAGRYQVAVGNRPTNIPIEA
jgi:hypothetical protein